MSAHHVLYRMHATDGALLYVGITMNPQLRLRDHRISQPWFSEVAQITLEHFGSRQELAMAERAAVRTESPKYNVVRYSSGRVGESSEQRAPRRRRFTPRATLTHSAVARMSTPPHVSLQAYRLALKKIDPEGRWDLDDICDRVEETNGDRPARGTLSAIENGVRGVSAELLAALEAAYKLPRGSITTDYTPRTTPAASDVA